MSEDLDQIVLTRLQELLPSNDLEFLDTYILTLVTVFSALPEDKVQLKVLELLLGLFINKETTESFSVTALSCLQRALLETHKHHILAWTARQMAGAGGDQEAKAVLSCLLLLCQEGTEPSFLSENLRYILPSIILCAGGESSSSVDTALDLVSR